MSDRPDAALTFDPTMPVLVTGASGTIGSRVVAGLVAAGRPVRAALVDPERSSADLGAAVTPVRFDFTDASTWPATFAGVETLFLVRPPHLSNVDRDMVPALEAAKAAGVRHMVLLSLQGADSNRFVPHAALEAWLRDSGLGWTFVRPSFFAENLSGTHVSDIRDRDEIVVPAGRGATAFVTADDVAAVAVATLLDPAAHRGLAWTPTGPAALTYQEVAATLSDVLGRPIRYRKPGVLRYARHARSALGMPWAMVGVTAAIYTVARLGRADGLTDDVRTVTGRDPVAFRDWAEQHRAVWARGSEAAA
jgi:uncharacterized protein YbjT (DUF2867 family)